MGDVNLDPQAECARLREDVETLTQRCKDWEKTNAQRGREVYNKQLRIAKLEAVLRDIRTHAEAAGDSGLAMTADRVLREKDDASAQGQQ